MEKNAKIYVCGHSGMVGSAIVRGLRKAGFSNILTREIHELDLTDQSAVRLFFQNEKPDYVFLAAAAVGGIKKNIEKPAEMLYINLSIQNNVIDCAYRNGVKKLLFLGSSCVYPRLCKQPMKEEYILTGPFEPTNEGYAIAKVAGLRMCEYYNRQYGTNFISIMPCNLYGRNDHYDENAHVLASLIRKFYEAKESDQKEVSVWGSGNQRREFLYVDDAADAALFLMEHYSGNEFINVGYGSDVSIRELASIIAETVGYKGKIIFDSSKPEGMPQKLLEVSKLTDLGWKYKTNLGEGIKKTLSDYLLRCKKEH
ncbi:MAG: GDP-L-fucose synthase [Bacilli bacterium]